MDAIKIRGMTKTYHTGFTAFGYSFGHDVTTLHGIDLTVPQGSIFAFLGPNGAGKTTTIKCLLGLSKPTEGTVELFNEPYNSHMLSWIGYSPDETLYYDHLTGRENIMLIGQLDGSSHATVEKRATKLLRQLDLLDAKDQPVKNYSHGMKKRLGLIISLINEPHLVLRDEPMGGLDPIGRKVVKDLIVSLKKSGVTIFFSTHILSDVEEIADNFAILHKGRLLTSKSVKSVKEDLEGFFIKTLSKE